MLALKEMRLKFSKKQSSSLGKGLMVFICVFITKIYLRLILHVICYIKRDKITGKCRFQVKATWVNIVAVYINTMYIYQNTV